MCVFVTLLGTTFKGDIRESLGSDFMCCYTIFNEPLLSTGLNSVIESWCAKTKQRAKIQAGGGCRDHRGLRALR